MSLPNGWEKIKLGDLVSVASGRNKVRNDMGKYPVYGSTGIIGLCDDFQYSGDSILIARVGANAGFIHQASGQYDVSDNTLVVECGKEYDFAFAYQQLRGINLNQYVFGSGQPLVTGGLLKKIELSLPPLGEQKKIAKTLSVWDDAIEKTEKLIEAKEKVLSEYGKDLFGRTNQKNKQNWESVSLSSVLIEHGDKSTGEEEVYSVSVHKGLVNQVEHLGRSFAAKNTSNYNCVHYGDIVYTKSPTGDFPLGIVKQSLIKEDVIVSPLYGVFTPKSFELGTILDFYFSSPTNANNYLHPIAQKGAKNTINITNKIFLSAKLYLPLDLKEQKKIAEFIQSVKQETSILQQLLENYKKQKQGLMQKLLTGQWRIK